MRNPGHTIQVQIEDLSDDIMLCIFGIPYFCLTILAAIAFGEMFGVDRTSSGAIFVYLLAFLITVPYLIVKAYRLFTKRNQLRLAYDCEQAVGQDLNNLIANGFKVYHDFPADGFNIDHIAIGPQGVFAIETKGRSKQLNLDKPNWKLEFDGVSLKFPTWTERGPVEQAKRQAVWLSKWLESSTGEPQHVIPVLAVPGWYIERTKPSEVRVFAGKGSQFLAKSKPVLSEKRIKAISHQVEVKCRDVKVKTYKKGKDD